MNIKRILSMMLAATMVFSMTACSGAKEEPKPEAEENQEAAEATTEDMTTDVVIIGGGGAGLSAAIEANDAGADVVVLEKMPFPGGNSLRATGGMNATETSVQAELGIEDSVQGFVDDTMKGGHELNNVELVTYLAENSASAIDWLAEIGAPLPEVTQLGGASQKRAHRPEGGAAVGSYLVKSLVENVESREINVMVDTTAQELVMTDGAATGVKAVDKDGNEFTVTAKAVILATGGFGANEDLYTKYKPELKGFVTTNHAGATGDGIVMAEAIGADTVDMDQIQIHPTVEQNTSMLITEAVRGEGAILVNTEGNRFTDGMGTRDAVSQAILQQPDGFAYLVFDQQLRDNLSAVEKYVGAKVVIEAETIEELASSIGMDPAVLSETVTTWNASITAKSDAEFGRTGGMDRDITVGPFYAIAIAPGVHHTMGGLKINTSAQVLNTDGEVIPNLFAAGEVTGGIHGGNRLGGNAVTDIVVFGRTAGTNAAALVAGE